MADSPKNVAQASRLWLIFILRGVLRHTGDPFENEWVNR
jgi:hypothetical protein